MNPVHALPIAEADARLFVTVADVGSFTTAALLHEMTPSAVSKAVSRLEGALGVRLLARTTRALHLTDEGLAFHERAARAFGLLAEAAEEATAGTRAVAGTVRIGLPSLFGTWLVAPRLPALLQRHPELRVEIVTTMRLSDIIDLRLDLAIAVGVLPDSSFAARPLGYGQFVTVAAPAYIEAVGQPESRQDLLRHRCVGYTRPDGRESPWEFSDGAIDVQAALRSDDMHHLAAMAAAGAGIAHLPLFVVARDLEAGRLLRLLPSHEPAPKLASLVYPAGRAMPRRVRAFIDFMLESESLIAGVSAAPGAVACAAQ